MSLTLFCVINPILGLSNFEAGLNPLNFILLLVSTTLIASAGYLLNDLVDMNVDSVNKPGRNIVGKKIRVHVVQILYWVFTILGILLGVYLSFNIGKINYSLVFLFAAGLLWFYSERYQCQPLVGNIVIAFLSALTIAIVWLFYFFALIQNPEVFASVQLQFSFLNNFILIYSGFAFISSLIREVVKDIEDLKGDDRFGCRTFPVVYGIQKARWFVILLVLLSLGLCVWCQIYFIGSGFEWLFYYFFLVDICILIILFELIKAKESKDYKRISSLTKVLMIVGILSMALVTLEI